MNLNRSLLHRHTTLVTVVSLVITSIVSGILRANVPTKQIAVFQSYETDKKRLGVFRSDDQTWVWSELPADAIEMFEYPDRFVVFCIGEIITFNGQGERVATAKFDDGAGITSVIKIGDEGEVAMNVITVPAGQPPKVHLLVAIVKGAKLETVHREPIAASGSGKLCRNGDRVWVIGRSIAQYLDLTTSQFKVLEK